MTKYLTEEQLLGWENPRAAGPATTDGEHHMILTAYILIMAWLAAALVFNRGE